MDRISRGNFPNGSIGWATAWAGLVFLVWLSAAQGAEEIRAIDNDPSNPAVLAQYDRFDNSSTFIGNPANWPAGPPTNNPSSPYVWSGVGRVVPGAQDLVTRPDNSQYYNVFWATMISPSFFVSAYHFHPGVGDTVRFYYGNDASGAPGTYEDASVAGGMAVEDAFPTSTGPFGADGDLWIGKLSTPVSSNVAKYPILSLPNISDYGGHQPPPTTDMSGLGISTFGLSATPDPLYPFGNQATVRLGRNVISLGTSRYYGSNEVGNVNVEGKGGKAYIYSFDNPGVGGDESQVMAGDSGGPSFFLYGGASPAITGVHWFEGTLNNTTISGDTLVPGYLQSSGSGTSYIQGTMNLLGNPTNETLTTESPVLGDFNLDGHLTAADLVAMESALTNLPNYETQHGMNLTYLKDIGDINGDGSVNNGDLQALINRLLAGNGSFDSVPEPASLLLLSLGGLGLLTVALRQLMKN